MTCNSPYLCTYVENESQELNILAEKLRNISDGAKRFGKCGRRMSEATRQLGESCKSKSLSKRNDTFGGEMSSILQIFGEILDEIADSQIQMCESIEASLSHSLETFAKAQIQRKTKTLRYDAETVTAIAETALAKYLHSGNQIRFKSWIKNTENDHEIKEDSIEFTTEKHLKNWENEFSGANHRENLEEILHLHVNAELKRFQLMSHLNYLEFNRNLELVECGLASLNGIKTYFYHCSDFIQGFGSRLQKLQYEKKKSYEKYELKQDAWDLYEKNLKDAVVGFGTQFVNSGISLDDPPHFCKETCLDKISMMSNPPFSSIGIKKEAKLWEEFSEFWRETSLLTLRLNKKHIQLEGWLYKKASNRLAVNSWQKLWFILDKTSFYYLKGDSFSEGANNKSCNNSYLDLMKVCDIVLCTVKEVNRKKSKENNGLRFCFEIICPNSRPYLLQACGPYQYKIWVDGIRNCLEHQLLHGHVPTDDFSLKYNSTKARRISQDNNLPQLSGESLEVSSLTTRRIILEKNTECTVNFIDNIPNFARTPEDVFVKNSICELLNLNYDVSASSKNLLYPKYTKIIQKILDSNRNCADCGKSSPEWASLNIGVLVCIECSGVHRSLGVHLSKVRSVRLDDLSRPQCNILLYLGNTFANSIWEAGVNYQKGWAKPVECASRREKEEWIKSKYMWRGFIEYRSDDDWSHKQREEKYNRFLYKAAKEGNLQGTAEALAKGASIDWKNNDEDNKTALHVCVVGRKINSHKWKGIEIAEFLLQNGANFHSLDSHQHSVLDSALIGNGEREMVEYLSSRVS